MIVVCSLVWMYPKVNYTYGKYERIKCALYLYKIPFSFPIQVKRKQKNNTKHDKNTKWNVCLIPFGIEHKLWLNQMLTQTQRNEIVSNRACVWVRFLAKKSRKWVSLLNFSEPDTKCNSWKLTFIEQANERRERGQDRKMIGILAKWRVMAVVVWMVVV